MRVPLLLMLAGCVEPVPDLAPFAVIGTGDARFEPLDDGDEILIIQGPQGGFHLLGSARFTGVQPGDSSDLSDPLNPTYFFRVYKDEVRIDYAPDYTQGLDRSEEPGVYEELGRFVFLNIESDDELIGEQLTLTVQLVDVNGIELFDSVDVIAQASPFNG